MKLSKSIMKIGENFWLEPLKASLFFSQTWSVVNAAVEQPNLQSLPTLLKTTLWLVEWTVWRTWIYVALSKGMILKRDCPIWFSSANTVFTNMKEKLMHRKFLSGLVRANSSKIKRHFCTEILRSTLRLVNRNSTESSSSKHRAKNLYWALWFPLLSRNNLMHFSVLRFLTSFSISVSITIQGRPKFLFSAF